jgi:hypothetical protein
VILIGRSPCAADLVSSKCCRLSRPAGTARCYPRFSVLPVGRIGRAVEEGSQAHQLDSLVNARTGSKVRYVETKSGERGEFPRPGAPVVLARVNKQGGGLHRPSCYRSLGLSQASLALPHLDGRARTMELLQLVSNGQTHRLDRR